MKIFLFGGAETSLGQVELELKLIEKVINGSGVSEVLHVPFARTDANEAQVEWRGDWFSKYIQLNKVG